MRYTIEITSHFEQEFKKLNRYTQKMLAVWINKNLSSFENPNHHEKIFTANGNSQWHYYIGDYRLICHLENDKLLILTLMVNQRDIYAE